MLRAALGGHKTAKESGVRIRKHRFWAIGKRLWPKTVLSHSQRDFVPGQSIFSQGCLVHHKKKCCKTGAKSPEKGLWFLMRTQQKAGSSTFQKKNPVK